MSIVEGLRRLTRPVLTLALVGTLCAIIVKVVWSVDIPQLSTELWAALIGAFTGSVTAALAFWFANSGDAPPNGS